VANTFHLDIVSPYGVLWSGDAVMLITRTTEGEMAVLANHQPLMGALVPWSAEITPAAGPKVVLAVRGGFLQVGGNRATLLTDMARAVEGDVAEARRVAAAMATEAEGR
jgi:F-type H+-transporting ATPase subunit epsilon